MFAPGLQIQVHQELIDARALEAVAAAVAAEDQAGRGGGDRRPLSQTSSCSPPPMPTVSRTGCGAERPRQVDRRAARPFQELDGAAVGQVLRGDQRPRPSGSLASGSMASAGRTSFSA